MLAVTGARSAGAALPSGADQYLQTVASDNTAVALFGTATQTEIDNLGMDSAVIWTSAAADPAAARIAGIPVAGAMTEAEVKALPPSTPICFDGAKSGVRCGPLIAATDMIEVPPISDHGDSGGAVFVVDANTHRATVIGLVTGLDKASGHDVATYIAPALDRLGAAIISAR